MQRRPTKNTRGPNQDEKDFQKWLKENNCCLSGLFHVHVHHCLGATAKHNKVLIGHYFCIPLSPEIHREYHSGSKAWRESHGLQSALWAILAEEYETSTGRVIPLDVKNAINSTKK